MTNVFSEGWEAGANGATCTTSNTAFTALVQPQWKFSNAHVLSGQGSMSGRIVCAAQSAIAQRNFTARSQAFDTIFLYSEGNPTVDTSVANYKGAGGTAVRAELRVLATGALQLRNSGFGQIVVSAAGMVPVNGWCRIEWMYNNDTGQQRVRLYKTNPLGTSPDYDSGLTATTAAGTVDQKNLGAMNATTWTATFGDFGLDDAEWPSYGTGPGTGGTVGLRASALSTSVSTGTTATIVIPATVQVGDRLVLKFWGDSGWSQTTPAGWQLRTSQSSAGISFNLWVKTAAAGDPGATVTISSNNTSGAYKRDLHLSAYSTALIGDIASTLASAAAAAHSTPQVSAVDPNAWAECGVADRASPGSQSWTLPANLALLKQHFGSGGGGLSSVTAVDDVVGSGPVGQNTITGTVVTASAVSYSVVIEPSTATVGGTVDAGPDRIVEPATSFSLTAILSGGASAPSWQQMSPADADKQLSLSGASTATVSSTAPAAVDEIVYKLRATATGATAPDDVNVTVLPATEQFVRDDGIIVPLRKQFLT